jgi:hypothetical protein
MNRSGERELVSEIGNADAISTVMYFVSARRMGEQAPFPASIHEDPRPIQVKDWSA